MADISSKITPPYVNDPFESTTSGAEQSVAGDEAGGKDEACATDFSMSMWGAAV
jgi:hypothetical protein